MIIKYKRVVSVLVVAAILVLPLAFSVSFAKWTGGASSINVEDVQIGDWIQEPYAVVFANGTTVLPITDIDSSQADNVVAKLVFDANAGDEFYIYYNGTRTTLKPVGTDGYVDLVTQPHSDNQTVYAAQMTARFSMTVTLSKLSFVISVSLGDFTDDELVEMLQQALDVSNKSDVRGIVTSNGKLLHIERWGTGITVDLEEGEQIKVYTNGNRADANAIVNSYDSALFDSDAEKGIYTAKKSGTYKITADQFIFKGIKIEKVN